MKKLFTPFVMLLIALLNVPFAEASAQDEPEKKDPGLSFEKTVVDYILGSGEQFDEPKLINPNNVPVYFVSDNNSAAAVDYATGEVTIISKGVITITAISEETEIFNPGFATYQINVSDNAVIFEADFITSNCGFKEVSEVEGVTAWEHESDGYMKADAYGKVDKMTAFYLVSPEFTLSATGNTVSFGQCGSYFGKNWDKYAQLVIREVGKDWQVLEREYPIGDQNTVKSTGDIKIPGAFRGKNVQLAFKYSSDGHSNSGVWHVRNLFVKSAASSKADAKLSFDKEVVEYVLGSGDAFTAPNLINPDNLEVKYYSDNEAVASVAEATGEVTINGEGTAVITAKSAETDAFEAGEASYTIRVKNTEDAKFADPATRSPMVAVEFTGQRCRYCPNTGRDLQNKQDKYGKENFIITALHHLTSFSQLPEGHVSLYNEEAMQYAESLEIHDGLPQMAYNSLGPGRSDLTLEEQFKQDDLLECTGNVTYSKNNEYNISIKTRLRSNQKEALNGKQVDIILWTLENKILAFQDDNGAIKNDYEHNHIFRGSVNTTWGEAYEVGTEYKNTLKAPAAVSEIKNTEIVVFFIDHETRMILDAGSFAAQPDDIAGIEEINAEDNDAPVYGINGMRAETLVKGGLYIKNGRKFIAR